MWPSLPHRELVWCAGLFDYLDNRAFVTLCRRLTRFVAPDSKLFIGNFSPRNPTRAYMEFGEWLLHDRSEGDLVEPAVAAGCLKSCCRVESEPEGVTLFLHIEGMDL